MNKKLIFAVVLASMMLFFANCSSGSNGGGGGNGDKNFSTIVLIEVDFGGNRAGMAKIKFNESLLNNELLPFYNYLDYNWEIFDDYECYYSDVKNCGLKDYFKNMKILGGVVLRGEDRYPFLRAYRNDTLFFIDDLIDELKETGLSPSDSIKLVNDLGLVLPKEENLRMDSIIYKIGNYYYTFESSRLISSGNPRDNWEITLKKKEFTKSFDGLFDKDKILTQNPVIYVVEIDMAKYPNVNFILQN